jgi:hypothetical protein
MNKSKKSPLDKLVELHPEYAETVARIRADEAAGLILDPCRTYKECRTWKQAWVYIFYRAHKDPDNFMQFEGEKVIRIVFIGRDFTDKQVYLLEKIAGCVGVNNDLLELRLIETSITPQGVGKLQAMLPKAAINFYTREDAKNDETIEYINTKIKWIKELHDKKEKLTNHS